ncbi:glycosyltransferase family 9 protein [Candidatus Woesearchaeota archaeon]|nr:glycosyltransferase family 9 protein [Candidatus Woesearchaeota archaeon]
MNIQVIRVVDRWAGSVLCSLGGVLTGKRPIPQSPETIAIIQLWGIGESILTLPSITAVKDHFPKARLTVIATKRNKCVFSGQPFIDVLQVMPLKPLQILSFCSKHRRAFDLVIDMEEYLNISALVSFFIGKFRVGFSHGARAGLYHKKVGYNDLQHCSEAFADLARSLGIKVKIKKLIPVHFTDADTKKVNAMLKESKLQKDRLVLIAPSVAESAKQRMWPLDRFASVADHLIGEGKQVAFIGIGQEQPVIQKILDMMKQKAENLAGKTTLPETACLAAQAILLIGNDSGPMHLSAAMGAKTIGLFGPNLPVRFRPLGKDNVAIYKATCHCSPAINIHKGEFKDCEEDGACMKSIQVEDVEKEVKRLLQ